MNRGLARDDRTWAEYTAKNGPMSLEMVLQVLSNLCWQLRVNERTGKPLTLLSGRCVRVSGRSARAYPVKRRNEDATAPELLRGAEPGGWTVVYQLAVLILQGMTGREIPHPLDRLEDDTVVQKWMELLELSPAAKDALLKGLALEPAQRYTSVNDFLDALGEMPVGMLREEPQQRKRKNGKKGRKGLWITLAVVLAVLLISGGVLGYYALQRDRYLKAAEQLNAFDFRQAEGTIAPVPDWMGADVPRIKDLAAAGLLFEDGEYEQARAQFERLGSFSVAPVMLERTDEALAEKAYQALVDEITALVQADKLEDAWTKMEQALEGMLSEDRKERLSAAYAQLIADKENPLTLYKQLKDYEKFEAFKTLRSDLIPAIYKKGEAAFYDGDFAKARTYLTSAGDYKKAKTYREVMASYDPATLIPYMNIPAIRERLHTESVLEKYLVGSWTGKGYIFDMEEDFSLTVDIPWGKLDAEYYNLIDGEIIQYSEDEEEKCFSITVVDMDEMDVYSYSLDETITKIRLDK